MRAWVGVGLAIAAAACSKGASKQCRADVEALSRALTAANIEPPVAYVGDADELVTRTDLPRTRNIYAPQVRVTTTGMTVNDRAVASTDALGWELAPDKLRGIYNRKAGLILFYIAPSVPWSQVVEAVSAAARAGFDAPGFMFWSPASTPTPPPPSAIDAKVKAILANEGGNRAVGFADLAIDVVKSCSALHRSFSRPAEDVEERGAAIIASISRGLIDCNCDVDLPSLHALMWNLLWNKNPSRVVAFDRAAPKQTVALSASTPWSEASKQFTPALRNAALVVAEPASP
ncbi:MAG: hypothetical protein SFX73_05995 [Kofleriaceae bacterium]|nr:hypothetical protein [Kofleriaceae bacterium]